MKERKRNVNATSPEINYYKILVCTPSNSAVDLITSRLINEGLFRATDRNNYHEIESEGEDEKLQGQEDKPDEGQQKGESKSNNKQNRKLPFILRIGTAEKEDAEKAVFNSQPSLYNKIQQLLELIYAEGEANSNSTSLKMGELQRELDTLNSINSYNLYHIINSLFFKELKRC
jgi:hypothetical protein